MSHPTWHAPVRIIATVLLVLWGGFWLWFSGMSLFSEWDPATAWEPLVKIVLPILTLTALGVWTPRLGGLLLIPASAFAAWSFGGGDTLSMFALPMLISGVALAVTGPWVRRWRRPDGDSPESARVTPA